MLTSLSLAWWSLLAFFIISMGFEEIEFQFRDEKDPLLILLFLGLVTFYILAILSHISIKKPTQNNVFSHLEPSILYEVTNGHNEHLNIYPDLRSNSKIDDFSLTMKNTAENSVTTFNSLHEKLDGTSEYRELQNEGNSNKSRAK